MNIELTKQLLSCPGVLEIRDVQKSEDAFLYSSGNRGSGYVMIKGLVSQEDLLRRILVQVFVNLAERGTQIDFVAGNVTGGMIPGWILAELLNVPFVYVRNTRKVGGKGEHVTGLEQSSLAPGLRVLVVEELVNFAETTINSAKLLRSLGYVVEDAACILDYGHAGRKLDAEGIQLTSFITLSELLKVADDLGRTRWVVAGGGEDDVNSTQSLRCC